MERVDAPCQAGNYAGERDCPPSRTTFHSLWRNSLFSTDESATGFSRYSTESVPAGALRNARFPGKFSHTAYRSRACLPHLGTEPAETTARPAEIAMSSAISRLFYRKRIATPENSIPGPATDFWVFGCARRTSLISAEASEVSETRSSCGTNGRRKITPRAEVWAPAEPEAP